MIIYVYNKAKPKIAHYARQVGMQVWTSIQDVPSGVIQNIQFNALERVDAIILELSNVNQEVLYLLAQSMILRKPTLCLYPEANPPIEILQHLAKKTIPTTVVKQAYTASNIEEIVQKFLANVDGSIAVVEIPYIKFTLRLTPVLERYLDWLNTQQQLNKAEFIRGLIKRHLDNNADYRTYIEREQENS